jgi:hypothetical protein
MRKLMLPLLAVCCVFAVSAPAAHSATLSQKLSKVSGALKGLQKAVGQMKDINDGQTSSINGVDTRVTTVVANLTSLSSKVDAIVAVATDSLTKLQAGLTTLAAAVQGPGIAGQLGAAGTAAPGTGNAATPSTLPTGTVYRQIVLGPGGLSQVPVGARTWVKMPDVTNPQLGGVVYDNEYVCVAGNTTAEGRALGAPANFANCS